MHQPIHISEMNSVNSQLKVTDFENFFDIHVDRRQKDMFNLNTTLYISTSASSLPTHTCTTNCFWPLISYKIYGTTRLAWLLMKLNGVTADDVFDMKVPGDKVYYIPSDHLQSILNEVNRTNG